MRPIIVDIAIVGAFVAIAAFAWFIQPKLWLRKHKKCPECGGEMQIKKKYQIKDKGRFGSMYVYGTIRSTIQVLCCTECKHEIFPNRVKDMDQWKDANEL